MGFFYSKTDQERAKGTSFQTLTYNLSPGVSFVAEFQHALQNPNGIPSTCPAHITEHNKPILISELKASAGAF